MSKPSNHLKETHESFLSRFYLKITPKNLAKLDFAYDGAKYAHRNQSRESKERYFEHVRAVALILVDEFGITDFEIISAALLHDALEDSFLFTGQRIGFSFNKRVTKIVRLVTKPEKDDPRFENKEEKQSWYFEQIIGGMWEAKVVKLADRLHNIRTLSGCSKEKQVRKIKETKDFCFPIIVALSKTHPDLAKKFRVLIEEAISELGL